MQHRLGLVIGIKSDRGGRGNGRPRPYIPKPWSPEMQGNSTRRVKSATSKQPKKAAKKPAKNARNPEVRHARLLSIKRSPENDKLYRPVDPTDPDIVALAESIREHGIRE